MIFTVESCKRGLTHDKQLQSSVDWLTEVIRRFSDAALAARPLTSVNMKSPMRPEKVCQLFVTKRITNSGIKSSGRNMRRLTPIKSGREMRLQPSRMPSLPTALNFALSEMKWQPGPCLKLCASTDIGKGGEFAVSSPSFANRFYSAKVGEENVRIIELGAPPKSISRQYSTPEEANDGQQVGLSEDEGSVVSQPSKSPSCGACRTRESKVWWKAPKGLATNILCDSCGTGWRKYADLNVRPVREESLPINKVRTANEKREGTPLSGPSVKRARVCDFATSMVRHLLKLYTRHLPPFNPLHHQLHRLYRKYDALPV
jgi:hypothetical protein